MYNINLKEYDLNLKGLKFMELYTTDAIIDPC